DRLDRPDEALDLLERVLAEAPGDRAPLPVLERALGVESARVRATAILERAAGAANDPALAVALIERLASARAAPPPRAPAAWFAKLLDRYEDRPDVTLGLTLRALGELPGDDALWDRAERLARQIDKAAAVADAYEAALESSLEPAALGRVGRRAVAFCEEW